MSKMMVIYESTRHQFKQQRKVDSDSFYVNKRFKRIIEKRLNGFGLNLVKTFIDNDNYCVQICAICQLKLLQNYQILINATIDKKRMLICKAKIIKDGLEYRVTNKDRMGLIYEFINNISQFFRYGNLNLHPQKQTIQLQLKSKLSFNLLKKTPFSNTIKLLLQSIQTIFKYTEYNIYKILYLSGQINQNFFKILKKKNIIVRDLDQQQFQFLNQLIKDLFLTERNDLPLMENKWIKQFRTAQAIPKVIDQTQMKALYNDVRIKQQNFENKQISTVTTESKTQDMKALSKSSLNHNAKNNNSQIDEYDIKKYEPYLKQTAYPMATNQARGIYNAIQFVDNDPNVWESFVKTSNTELFKGKFRFRFSQAMPTPMPTVEKYLIKKVPKGIQSFQKCQHQKSILKILSSISSLNIGKFYEVKEKQYQNSIIMDLYSESSCDIYLKDNKRSLSLKTKMSLLHPIVQGMRVLRDSKIVHLDLKYQNVLIGRALVPRLTDFGQSYNINSNEIAKNGYTFPYVPHQQFSSNQTNRKNSRDTYSFGIMMDLIFTSRHILSFRRPNQHNFIQKLQSIQYPKYLSFIPQKYLKLFPAKLSRLLWTICLLSIHPNPEKRPNQDIISIVLKCCQKFIDSLIS